MREGRKGSEKERGAGQVCCNEEERPIFNCVWGDWGQLNLFKGHAVSYVIEWAHTHTHAHTPASSIYLCVCVFLSVWLTHCLSVCLTVCLFVYLFIRLFIFLTVCLFVFLCIRLSVFRLIYRFVSLSLSLSVSLSLCLLSPVIFPLILSSYTLTYTLAERHRDGLDYIPTKEPWYFLIRALIFSQKSPTFSHTPGRREVVIVLTQGVPLEWCVVCKRICVTTNT